MRKIAILGAGAEYDAGRLLRAARADGVKARGARLAAPADAQLAPDCRSFVAAHGALWPDAAFWLEWGSGAALSAEQPEDAELLVLASPDPASLKPGFAGTMRPAEKPAADRYGRPMPERAHGITLRIGLLGGTEDPALQPAVGAAIGDAADRMGVTIELVTLADPKALPRGLAGLVLPGGSAMASVPAQCEAALQAADSGLPVFGLCLGMQSMATALMRGTWPDAMLEEIAGPGAHRSFVRLRGAAGPRHRLGEARFVPAPGTRLAELMPKGAAVRLNHRYAMAPDAPLPTEATIHRGPDGIAEAIELTGHPFFIGLQGHPEFGCDPALAALWDGFLAAACERSR